MPDPIRLTTTAKAAGCAAKLSPSILDSVLKKLPRQNDPNVLVGFETSDDAAVYRVSDDLALVQTTDFFTPIVDDPGRFGQVAAANALSDIYAMGGRPISALTLVAFPAANSPDILEQILRGGLEKMCEANCTVVGGHSIRDDELKFGYAVTGLIHPAKIWRNVGARPGDALLFTKPLGTGVIATALKQGRAEGGWVAAAEASMTRLNRDAADALHDLDDATEGMRPVHAVTDVTGFGLLGHLFKMCRASGVGAVIDRSQVPVLDAARVALRDGFVPGGSRRNLDWVRPHLQPGRDVTEDDLIILADAQTSGGLLVVGEVPGYPVIGHTVAGSGLEVR